MSDEPKEGVADEATPEESRAEEASFSEEQRARIDAFFISSGEENASRRSFEETSSSLFRRTRIVLGVFLMGVALAVYVAAGIEVAETDAMEEWPMVIATVRSSSTVSQFGVDVIRYEVVYNVEGMDLRQEVNMSTREGAPKVGDPIPLRVDPEQPMRVVVAKGMGDRVIFSDKAIAVPLALGATLLLSLLVF